MARRRRRNPSLIDILPWVLGAGAVAGVAYVASKAAAPVPSQNFYQKALIPAQTLVAQINAKRAATPAPTTTR